MAFKSYRHWPVRWKIMTIPVLSFIVILFGVELFILPFVEQQLMEQRRNAVKQSVEVAYGILEDRAKLAKDGKLAIEDAQNQTIETIRTLRYNGKEYFWINDLGKPVPKMIMHPTVPSLDGKVLDDSKFNKATSMQEGLDGPVMKLDNKNLFVSFNEAVGKSGQGLVTYE
ncbi:MAG: cache domain-containing protein [Geobacter sp.]|nr:cache domain-containing protein [Geobacter sp.]